VLIDVTAFPGISATKLSLQALNTIEIYNFNLNFMKVEPSVSRVSLHGSRVSL
jgi:hypothetical protein